MCPSFVKTIITISLDKSELLDLLLRPHRITYVGLGFSIDVKRKNSVVVLVVIVETCPSFGFIYIAQIFGHDEGNADAETDFPFSVDDYKIDGLSASAVVLLISKFC